MNQLGTPSRRERTQDGALLERTADLSGAISNPLLSRVCRCPALNATPDGDRMSLGPIFRLRCWRWRSPSRMTVGRETLVCRRSRTGWPRRWCCGGWEHRSYRSFTPGMPQLRPAPTCTSIAIGVAGDRSHAHLCGRRARADDAIAGNRSAPTASAPRPCLTSPAAWIGAARLRRRPKPRRRSGAGSEEATGVSRSRRASGPTDMGETGTAGGKPPAAS